MAEMHNHFDLIIRGGTVVDGSGAEPFVADVGVLDGRILDIGSITGTGREELDANERIVTPGFIDIHTHYDGQVTWEDRLFASSAHGVTTVVMGNCGVGFAPCRPGDRKALVELMGGVEDIPELVMSAGLPWDWETFPDYLDAIERRPHDIDVAAQIPHSALRVYVMGSRGVSREPANDEDIKRIERLVTQAIRAGAIGFSTSRFFYHRTSKGDAVPSVGAQEAELQAIARGIRAAGGGIIEAIINFEDFEEEFELLKNMARTAGGPLSYCLSQVVDHPDQWRRALELTDAANVAGLCIKAQVIGRPIGLLFGLDLSYNPLSWQPSYRAIAQLPLDERVRRMRDPETRRRILGEQPIAIDMPTLKFTQRYEWLFPLGDPPLYEPPTETSVAALAARKNIAPLEVIYDLLLEKDGHAILFLPITNYAERDLSAALTMLKHDHAIVGIGDAGAHYGIVCDSSFPTFMLAYWARDRHGEKLDLPWVVKALTQTPAEHIGLNDRGRIEIGYKADLNVIDHRCLRLHAPEVHRDLPAGGRRLMQTVTGFDATIVGGVIVNRHAQPTGALPGRLVRGRQAKPSPPAVARSLLAMPQPRPSS